MKNKKKKRLIEIKRRSIAFEMMVVLLIIGLLVGAVLFFYDGFDIKANNARAVAELREAQETILSDLVSADGGEDLIVECDGVKFEYNLSNGKVKFSGKTKTSPEQMTKEMKEKFKDLSNFEGTFECDGNMIIYTTDNKKGRACWENGKSPKQLIE